MDQDRKTERLGKRAVEAARPRASVYRIWDADLKGFGLKISPRGLKTYFVWYRFGQGRTATRREYTIARHGEMTPEQARAEAATMLSRIRLGEDPQDKRQRARAEMSVAELCRWYFRDGVALKKESTLESDRARVRAHVIPLLGKRSVSSITAADVTRFLRDVAAGKTAIEIKPTAAALKERGLKGKALSQADRRRRTDSVSTGGKGTATRTVGTLGAIFTFAVREGLRTDNPVRGVERFKDKQSQRFLSADELGRLTHALTAAEVAGVNPYALNVIRLLALTGARKNEIQGLKWSEVDFPRRALKLADSKTGARSLPLGSAALMRLQALPRTGASPFVFPSERRSGGHYIGTSRVWREIRVAAGLPDVRLHDLRHTFASFAVADGLSLPMIGAMLGHRDYRTTQQYAHLADDPLRHAADRTAAAIAGAMQGPLSDVTAA